MINCSHKQCCYLKAIYVSKYEMKWVVKVQRERERGSVDRKQWIKLKNKRLQPYLWESHCLHLILYTILSPMCLKRPHLLFYTNFFASITPLLLYTPPIIRTLCSFISFRLSGQQLSYTPFNCLLKKFITACTIPGQYTKAYHVPNLKQNEILTQALLFFFSWTESLVWSEFECNMLINY